ncbi:hypothetical protein IC619_015470 [Hazenella sp. IB182353]|uniref:hypothetical protein n=1 Tax=Polycladospora coralii TaxID=2771432 RepID=UPI001747C199|nr:hypothetical protein [Polycladospora coralii]MBS7531872.1 hypothetical protein [Polycladospora coralii]
MTLIRYACYRMFNLKKMYIDENNIGKSHFSCKSCLAANLVVASFISNKGVVLLYECEDNCDISLFVTEYEMIMKVLDIEERNQRLGELMKKIEAQCQKPAVHNTIWKSKCRDVFDLYRKIALSRK